MAVVENSHERQIRTAVWLLPLYMLLINVFVIPIAAGGLLQGLSVKDPDSFVLGLPMQAGKQWLSLIVFIGGFSAATGMIIVEAMAVATMVSNHLLMPIIDNVRRLNFLRRSLLRVRWLTIAGVLVTGYAFERAIGGSFTLVNMGIISFVAVFQFAPPSWAACSGGARTRWAPCWACRRARWCGFTRCCCPRLPAAAGFQWTCWNVAPGVSLCCGRSSCSDCPVCTTRWCTPPSGASR
jgi:Na+/proline symporter